MQADRILYGPLTIDTACPCEPAKGAFFKPYRVLEVCNARAADDVPFSQAGYLQLLRQISEGLILLKPPYTHCG